MKNAECIVFAEGIDNSNFIAFCKSGTANATNLRILSELNKDRGFDFIKSKSYSLDQNHDH